MTPQPPRDPLAPIRDASPERPFVVAQLGQSLDGRIATATGESRWINGDAALDHLHRIRAEVDAVVVGIGTVLADDPLLTVRRVPLAEGRPQPARVIIDTNGRLPARDLKLFDPSAGPAGEVLVVTADDRPAHPTLREIRLPRGPSGLDPAAIVISLFQAGFRKLLIEGGATTVSRFIDARVVDRLHVLVAPLVIGSGRTGLDLVPIGRLRDAIRSPAAVHLLADGDVLFDCDLSAVRASL